MDSRRGGAKTINNFFKYRQGLCITTKLTEDITLTKQRHSNMSLNVRIT